MAALLEDYLMNKLKALHFCNNITLMIVTKVVLSVVIVIKLHYGASMSRLFFPSTYLSCQFLFGSSIVIVLLTYLSVFSTLKPSTAGLSLYTAILTLCAVGYIIFAIWLSIDTINQYTEWAYSYSYPYSQPAENGFVNYTQGGNIDTWNSALSCCESNGCMSVNITQGLLNSFNQSNNTSTVLMYYPRMHYTELAAWALCIVIIMGLLVLFQIMATNSAYLVYKGIKYQRAIKAQMSTAFSYPRMQ